jgi:hypothetical protein
MRVQNPKPYSSCPPDVAIAEILKLISRPENSKKTLKRLSKLLRKKEALAKQVAEAAAQPRPLAAAVAAPAAEQEAGPSIVLVAADAADAPK